VSERQRSSLFWPIAGVFLLVLLVGTFAQYFLVAGVVAPIQLRETRARAELAVARAANAIAAAETRPDRREIARLIESQRAEADLRAAWLLFLDRDGPDLSELLARGGRRGEGPPDESGRGRGPRLRLPRDGGRDGQPRRIEVLTRREVTWNGEALGEIVAVRRARARLQMPWQAPASFLLFVPVSLLFSAAAGLLMVRLLVRRLRAMEALAARVAEGDLSVRLADRSGDEIGRVADRLDRMTEGLAEARDRLEAQERQRRQLFADITHELATPLTSIRGYAETLTDPAVPLSDPERARYQRGVLEEAGRLDRLIRDLFELARLEAGAAPLERVRLDWAALCANVAERFAPRFRDAGLELTWARRVESAWISADGHRMEEVLENLLANALRYVPRGGAVLLALDAVAGSAGPAYALTVSDDGPGVGAEALPHLFERFYRSPEARASSAGRAREGSGLGLAIVHEIVERHGGTASAESRAPQGLTIRIELPADGTTSE
jgi:signal transduction histidine kinase